MMPTGFPRHESGDVRAIARTALHDVAIELVCYPNVDTVEGDARGPLPLKKSPWMRRRLPATW